ncbi:MAG: phenylalanine--tRNA ligase subunit beta [Bacteroidia bacterium]|nr:phenylalanine--tRNA ligase subunit beta [Bacteroidia bacterium]
MKISYSWLKQFVDFTHTPEELSKALTDCGLEVEHLASWESVTGGLQGLVIGKVLTCSRHPNADRLSVTTVDAGDGLVRQIVCGAPNVAAGQTVVVALPGAKLYPAGAEPFEIKKSKIRGEVSEGMICAEDEIGLGNSHAGIMILPDHLGAGTPAAEYFNVSQDWIFEIGLTPNRADAASHLGVARDIRALLSIHDPVPLRMPDVSGFRAAAEVPSITVQIDDPEACIRYSGVEIKGVKVGPSPEWLQHRLKSIGLRPINNVVDVTNYVMHELGQPLHAFDVSGIRGNRIRVGTLPAGTVFKTLDETERVLQGSELMINDAVSGMCIAGVFGGMDSGVSENTTHLFLESACFHPVQVRKSARQHGLHTDSSFRFERGTDPNMTLTALKRAAVLITELAGGEVSSTITDLYPVKVEDRKVNLSFDYLKTIIGDELPRHEVIRILESLDVRIIEDQSDWLLLTVPPYRVDVTRAADLAEEVLRIYGYNNIGLPKKISITPGRVSRPDMEEILERSGSALVAHGFREILTNSLTKLSYLETMKLPEGKRAVEVLNPLSGDLALLRHQMMLTGLEAVAYNINRRQKDLRFFEWGKTYMKSGTVYLEEQHLCLWLSGDPTPEHWKVKAGSYDIYFIKAVLENVFTHAGLEVRSQLSMKQEKTEGLEDSLTYYAGKTLLATAGRVEKRILKSMDISQGVWYADIRLEALFRVLKAEDPEVPGPPRFPEVRRDLSMLLDRGVLYADLEQLAYQTEPRLLRAVNLFDVYEGEKIEQGKKSYALSFILRDEESTLQDKQIDAVMNKLMKQFETRLGAVIRKA